MKKIYFLISIFTSLAAFSQVGVGTTTPKATLDVTAEGADANGIADVVASKDGFLAPRVRSLAVNGEVNGQMIYLTQTYTDASVTPSKVYKEGFYFWKTDKWIPSDTSLNLDIDEGGTLIAVDGEIKIAQEIIVQMDNDHTHVGNSTPTPIKNLTNEAIDNQSAFTGTSTNNNFIPSDNGIYLIQMNILCTFTTTGADHDHKPVIGLWDNTTNKWVARTNPKLTKDIVTTMSLLAAIHLDKTHTYSFRASTSTNFDFTIHWQSSGNTGASPVSIYSIRRIR